MKGYVEINAVSGVSITGTIFAEFLACSDDSRLDLLIVHEVGLLALHVEHVPPGTRRVEL